MGLRIVLADVDEAILAVAGAKVGAIVGEANVITVVTDVSNLEDVKALKERALDAFGEVRCVCWNRLIDVPPPLTMRSISTHPRVFIGRYLF
jgi:NAD(P)-dependent dehydrogenase (short-subunit alcohol dehydrogenase family)